MKKLLLLSIFIVGLVYGQAPYVADAIAKLNQGDVEGALTIYQSNMRNAAQRNQWIQSDFLRKYADAMQQKTQMIKTAEQCAVQLKTCQANSEALTKQVTEKVTMAEDLQQQLKQAAVGKVDQAVQANLGTLEAEVVRLNRELADAQERALVNQETVTALMKQMGDIENIMGTADPSQFGSAIESLKKTAEMFKRGNEALAKELEENKNIMKQLQKESTDCNEQLLQEHKQCEANKQELNQLKKEFDQYDKLLTEARNERDKYEEELEQVKKQLGQATAGKVDQAVQANLTTLENEANRLKEDLDNCQQQLEIRTESFKELMEALTLIESVTGSTDPRDIQLKLANLEKAVGETKKINQELTQEIASVKKERDELSAAMKKLGKEPTGDCQKKLDNIKQDLRLLNKNRTMEIPATIGYTTGINTLLRQMKAIVTTGSGAIPSKNTTMIYLILSDIAKQVGMSFAPSPAINSNIMKEGYFKEFMQELQS